MSAPATGGPSPDIQVQGSNGKGGSNASVMDKSSWAYNRALANANAMRTRRHNSFGSANMLRGMNTQPDQIASGINRYMNPYENQVIGNTMNDMERQRQMMQGGIADQAAGAGAFGGDRHGIESAMTNSEVNRNMGNLAGQMRNQGWQTAAGLSNQDIQNTMAGQGMEMNRAQALHGMGMDRAGFTNNARMQKANLLSGLSGQGFNFGNTLNQQQQAVGNQQQQLLQNVLTGGAQEYQNYLNQPYKSMQALQMGMAGNPLGAANTQAQTSNPGKGGILGLGAQTAGTVLGGPIGGAIAGRIGGK